MKVVEDAAKNRNPMICACLVQFPEKQGSEPASRTELHGSKVLSKKRAIGVSHDHDPIMMKVTVAGMRSPPRMSLVCEIMLLMMMGVSIA
jgi:hypothetical protein